MRIVILCNETLSAFDQAVVGHILRTAELEIVGLLINIRKKPSALQRIKREWKKGRGGYILVQVAKAMFNKFSKSTSIKSIDFAASKNVNYLLTASLYTETVSNWIASLKPDVLLLRGFGIIKEPVLSIVPYGVLSYHHANILTYRGGPPVFWELYNNEREVGVTLQILDEGLDTGTIVMQKAITINKTDSWGSLRARVYKQSETMAAEALLLMKKSGPLKNPVGAQGKLYTLPNLNQWINLHVKLLKRRFK